jgi:hypothetical protein
MAQAKSAFSSLAKFTSISWVSAFKFRVFLMKFIIGTGFVAVRAPGDIDPYRLF